MFAISHAWSLLSCLFRARAGKRILLKNHGNTSITFKQQIFDISDSFFPIELSYERAENELSINVIFFLKFRYRSPNKFLVALLHIVFIHSCVKNVSCEWYQMKEEDPSFPNMYHLFIIIMNEIWLNNDKSRVSFFWDALYNTSSRIGTLTEPEGC